MPERLPRRARRVAEQTIEVLKREGWHEAPDGAGALTMAGLHSWKFAKEPYGAVVSIDDDGAFYGRLGLAAGDSRNWPAYRSAPQFATALRMLASESRV